MFQEIIYNTEELSDSSAGREIRDMEKRVIEKWQDRQREREVQTKREEETGSDR